MAEERIFIDSNVWFSAFYKKGLPFRLLEKLTKKKHKVVISELVLEEVIRNVKEKLPQVSSLVQQFFLNYPLTVIKNPSSKELRGFSQLAERKDVPILTAAVNYKCRYLITGNTKDFKISKIEKKYKLKVVKPRKALELF